MSEGAGGGGGGEGGGVIDPYLVRVKYRNYGITTELKEGKKGRKRARKEEHFCLRMERR